MWMKSFRASLPEVVPVSVEVRVRLWVASVEAVLSEVSEAECPAAVARQADFRS